MGPSFSIIEKLEILFQKDPKETLNKQTMNKKFEDDYKKYQKHGDLVLDKLNPHFVPNIKYQDILTGQFFDQKALLNNNTTLQLSDQSHLKNNQQFLLNSSKASSNKINFSFNNSKSTAAMFSSNKQGLKDIEWLKYAADREDALPSILKNTEMKSYLQNVPYIKDDSFQIPNMVKKEQQRARLVLLQELGT